MAATVEGVFRLIDRASGPLRKIEAQAKKTEMALKSAGGNLDHIGDNKQLRSLDETERKMRNVSRGTQVLDKDLDRTRRTTRRSSREFDGLSGSLRRLAGAFAGLRALRMPIMFGGILAAIKPLVAIVGALGGGVVALVPKLTDLAGVAGALPATFLGIGLAIGTAKLAFADLGKALGGNKKAMAALTPEARSFVRTLKQYKPVLQDIRREAQKGLFPGLEYSIRRLQRAVPMVQRLVGRMGRAMGGEAKGWANFLTTGGNLRDLERLGNQGIRIFRRISQGARNIAAALIDVASAARPFTEWLTKTLLRGTRQFRDFVHHGRETGKLAAFFDRTKDALKRFWSIATNLWNVFRGISKAARPLGEDLWRSLDRITRGWARWVDSTKGRGDLNAWFSGLRPTLRELGGLVGDLSKALFRMTGPQSQNQTAGMIGQIREWIPVLERIFDNATKVFGPAMLDAIKQLGRTIEILLSGGAGGALTMLLNTFTTILTAVNDLMDKFPALGRIITAALTVLGLSRLMTRIASFGGEVGGLATKWWGVKRAADAAAGAEARAMGGGTGPLGGGPIIGPGSRGGGARPRPLPGETVSPGGVILPGAATRGGGSVAAPAGRFARLRAGVTAGRAARAGGGGLRAIGGAAATGAGLRGAAGLGLRGAAGIGLRAAGAAGGFLWPVAALSAGIGALTTKGTATERTLGAVRGATMGLWNDPITRKEHRDKAEAALATKLSDLPGGLDVDPRGLDVPTLQKRTGRLRQEIGAEKAKEGATKVVAGMAGVHRVAAGPNKVEHEATMKRLTDEYNAEREILKAEQARAKAQRNIALNAVSREKAKNLLVDLGHAFDIWAKKRTPEIAMQKTVSGALEKIRTMRPAGARIVAQNTLEWAKEQAKHNPKFLKEVDKLERGIKTRFSRVGHHVRIVNGQILTGSKGEWKSIADSLITQTEQRRRRDRQGLYEDSAEGHRFAPGDGLRQGQRDATSSARRASKAGRQRESHAQLRQAANPAAQRPRHQCPRRRPTRRRPGDPVARAPRTGGPADVRAPSATSARPLPPPEPGVAT